MRTKQHAEQTVIVPTQYATEQQAQTSQHRQQANEHGSNLFPKQAAKSLGKKRNLHRRKQWGQFRIFLFVIAQSTLIALWIRGDLTHWQEPALTLLLLFGGLVGLSTEKKAEEQNVAPPDTQTAALHEEHLSHLTITNERGEEARWEISYQNVVQSNPVCPQDLIQMADLSGQLEYGDRRRVWECPICKRAFLWNTNEKGCIDDAIAEQFNARLRKTGREPSVKPRHYF